MNPATQALLRQLEDPDMQAFVEAWDALEELAVAVYRGGGADTEQSEEFAQVKQTLEARYPAWAAALEAHWRATKINGELVSEDPFAALIALPDAAAIVGNWAAMQTLPAAREALNGLLVERIERGGKQ